MNESTKLKPCPFCGGNGILQAIDFYPDYSDPPIWWVACETCGAHTDEYEGDTEAEAIAAWNTRAERTCHQNYFRAMGCFECSACGGLATMPTRYCPNCGAKVVKE